MQLCDYYSSNNWYFDEGLELKQLHVYLLGSLHAGTLTQKDPQSSWCSGSITVSFNVPSRVQKCQQASSMPKASLMRMLETELSWPASHMWRATRSLLNAVEQAIKAHRQHFHQFLNILAVEPTTALLYRRLQESYSELKTEFIMVWYS